LPVNYSTVVRTNRLQIVINAIDAGPSNGFMRLTDAGGNVLSSLQLARPCAVASNGVMTFNGLSLIDPAAAASGVALGCRFEDSTGTVVMSGLTVGTGSTSEVIFSPTNNIIAGQTVAITAATITGN
jgi:hypothetical protein